MVADPHNSQPMSSPTPAARQNPSDILDDDPRCVTRPAVRTRTANAPVSSRSAVRGLHHVGLPKDKQPSLRESRSNLSQPSQSTARQSSKKKTGGVLGFLKLKEPSTSALQDFADHERKRAMQKGGKAVTAGSFGASSQKLPEYVPKVNSKWDGLPEPSKVKHRKGPGLGDSKIVAGARNSISSHASTVSHPQNNGRPNTGPPDVYGCSLAKLPPTTRPELHSYVQRPLNNGSSISPSPSPHISSACPVFSEPPELLRPDSSSCMSMSPEASPRTPAFEEGAFPLPRRTTKSRVVTEPYETLNRP